MTFNIFSDQVLINTKIQLNYPKEMFNNEPLNCTIKAAKEISHEYKLKLINNANYHTLFCYIR